MGANDEGHTRHLLSENNSVSDRNSETSSEFDLDEENFLDNHPENAYKHAPRRRRRRGWHWRHWSRSNWGTIQCPTINRKQKLLIFSLTLLFLLLACATVYGKKHGIPQIKKPAKPGAPKPPPPPKPTFCSTWPVREKREVETREVSIERSQPRQSQLETRATKWKKPSGFKIVATVFYGRRRNVDVLDCYLQKNLVRNGGYLDKVHFMVHTADEVDRKWIEQKAAATEDYEYIDLKDCTHLPYGCIWDYIAEEDTLYVKIDDDIAYIHEDAIPQLVQTRLEQPFAFAVSANLVNSPLTGWLHLHFGAIHPYLPDPAPRPYYLPTRDWRVSQLPFYEGNKSINFDADHMEPPFPGHRWLPLSRNDTNMDNMMTPMGVVNNWGGTKFGLALNGWGVAAQQHYSLFQNIEDDTMDKYHFGSRVGASEALWNMQYVRYNLNFIAIWGKDVRANLPIEDDDEQGIGVTLPKKLGRPFFVDTKSVVAHLHFGPQTRGMLKTDVLDRYRALANEMVCKADNQKEPIDERCPWVAGMDTEDL